MEPIKTDYSNITFKAEGCGDLPATLLENTEGGHVVETVWELTDEEIERITRDRRLYLYIVGAGVPPLLPSTECLQHAL